MKIIDRYIIRQFILNFIILSIVFMLLFVLVDFIVDMDEFLEAGELRGMQMKEDISATVAAARIDSGEKPGAWFMILGTAFTSYQYYGPMVLLVYVYLSGLLVTGAMGFTFAQMVRAREIIAMLASGVSLYRVAAPVVLAGCALNMLTLPIQELAIPQLIEYYKRKDELGVKSSAATPVEFARDLNLNLINARNLNDETQTLDEVSILVRGEAGITKRHIIADSARWDEQRQGWLLENGTIIDPRTAGLGDRETADFFATDLSPTKIKARQAAIYARLLSSAELIGLSDDPRIPAVQIMHSRFSMLAVNALVLIMGIPFFVVRLPSDTLFRSIQAAGICIGAWITGLVMMQMVGQLNPVAAAWLPVVIFLPASALLLQTVKS